MKQSIALLLLGVSVLLHAYNLKADTIQFSATFENLKAGESVLDYYNGGFGGYGSGPGPAYGVTFSPNFFVAASQGSTGQVGAFTGTSAVMDVADGFTGIFSFYYLGTGTVSIFSGLDGTGTQLYLIDLQNMGVFWSKAITLSDSGRSVVFQGQGIQFDSITQGEAVIPEPTTIVLVGTGLFALAGKLRKRI